MELICYKGVRADAHRVHTHTHTHSLNIPWLVEALVSVVLQQRPGDAVVGGVMQQDTLTWLVRGRARAQGAAAAQAKSKLKVPVRM